jgi:hypothetical protein
MRRKVTVIGDPDVVAASRQYAKVVTWPSPDASGADVVVVADGDRLVEVADFIARRTPAAVVVATDTLWCAELLERTRFPRGRVLAAQDVAAVVDAVLGESGAELDVTIRHDGEHGQDGFHRVRARVGGGGAFAV